MALTHGVRATFTSPGETADTEATGASHRTSVGISRADVLGRRLPQGLETPSCAGLIRLPSGPCCVAVRTQRDDAP